MWWQRCKISKKRHRRSPARWEDKINADWIITNENTSHLLVPLPDSPQVVDVQLWLYILLSVEGDEWDLGQKWDLSTPSKRRGGCSWQPGVQRLLLSHLGEQADGAAMYQVTTQLETCSTKECITYTKWLLWHQVTPQIISWMDQATFKRLWNSSNSFINLSRIR